VGFRRDASPGRSRASPHNDNYSKGRFQGKRDSNSKEHGGGGWGRGWRRDGEDDRNDCARGGEGYHPRDWDQQRRRERHGSSGEVELLAPCIWIGGCPHDITELEIERVCSKYGPVHGITIKQTARDTFAFAWYSQLNHAKDAIRGLDQTSAFGAPFIKVAPANRRVSEKGADATPQEAKEPRDHHQRYRDPSEDHTRRNPSGRDFNGYRNGDGGGGKGGGKGCGGGGGGGWRRQRSESRGRRNEPPPRQRERSRTRSRSRQPLRRGSGRQGTRPTRVHLSQLPRDFEEDELMDITSQYGKVLASELHREGAYKCGWVEYATKAEAEAAVNELDERRMDEWSMRLQAYLYPGGGS